MHLAFTNGFQTLMVLFVVVHVVIDGDNSSEERVLKVECHIFNDK